MANYYFTIPDSVTLPTDGNKVSLTTACELHRDDSAVPNALTVAADSYNVFLADTPGTGTATAPDVTAPTLSSPTGAKSGETGATSLGVSTNEGNGTLYWGIYPTASTPSAADVVAGTGATVNGSQAVSGTGVQSVSDQTGLTAGTAYKAHYVQDDAASNRSSVATSSEFTTDAASGASATDNFSYTGNLEDQAVWTPLNTHPGPKPQANGSVAYVASASQNSSWIMENQTVLANDQACEIAFASLGAGSGNKFHLLLRMTDEDNYYRVEIREGTIKDIDKCVAGVFTEIHSNDTAVTPGDVIRFEAEGTALRVKVNGTTQLSGTDAAHASGKSGIHFDVAGGVITTDATIDYFTAEDL